MAIVEIHEKIEIKNRIILYIKRYHPETVNQVIAFVQKKTLASDKEIIDCLIELQQENKVALKKIRQNSNRASRKNFFFKPDFWTWSFFVLILFALNGALVLCSMFSYLIYMQYIIGFVLVLFLPGFAFLRLLFGSKMVIDGNMKMDFIEVFGLSVGLSTVLVPMVALALNYTPWGISFESLVTSLFITTIVLMTGVVLREKIGFRSIIQTLYNKILHR